MRIHSYFLLLSILQTRRLAVGSTTTIATTTMKPSTNTSSPVHCETNKDAKKCSCPMDPLTAKYLDPTDSSCQRYYLCHLGHAFLKYCDLRSAFHPGVGDCLPRSRIPHNVCPPPVNCDKNGNVADASDCTMYYLCFYGQSYHYGCKEDQYYDKEKGSCVLDKKKSHSCRNERATGSLLSPPVLEPISSNAIKKRNYEEPLLEENFDTPQPQNEPVGAPVEIHDDE